MALESATYIDGLVITNPAGSDSISQGDDHIRLIKKVLKNTFPDASSIFKGVKKITHFEDNAGADVRSTAFTDVFTFQPVKDSAATDLIILARVSAKAWNYNIDQDSTFRIYDNDSAATIGLEFQGTGYRFPAVGTGSGSGGNYVWGNVAMLVTESTPLAAGTKTFKIQMKCTNTADGGISAVDVEVTVLEISAP
tara:strand:- start:273 stop:857 length:585 start_codon:yes stop_codon:yes gene_type:complete